MAERRIKRFGLKGMMFAIDLAFTNGAILNRCLAPQVLPAKDKHLLTKVSFLQHWAQEQFDRIAPMRRRTPAGMRILQTSALNSASHANAASAHAMQRTEHELVDMGGVVRALGYSTQQAHNGPKKRKGSPMANATTGTVQRRKRAAKSAASLARVARAPTTTCHASLPLTNAPLPLGNKV